MEKPALIANQLRQYRFDVLAMSRRAEKQSFRWQHASWQNKAKTALPGLALSEWMNVLSQCHDGPHSRAL